GSRHSGDALWGFAEGFGDCEIWVKPPIAGSMAKAVSAEPCEMKPNLPERSTLRLTRLMALISSDCQGKLNDFEGSKVLWISNLLSQMCHSSCKFSRLVSAIHLPSGVLCHF